MTGHHEFKVVFIVEKFASLCGGVLHKSTKVEFIEKLVVVKVHHVEVLVNQDVGVVVSKDDFPRGASRFRRQTGQKFVLSIHKDVLKYAPLLQLR